jgi:hypothetical protein
MRASQLRISKICTPPLDERNTYYEKHIVSQSVLSSWLTCSLKVRLRRSARYQDIILKSDHFLNKLKSETGETRIGTIPVVL